MSLQSCSATAHHACKARQKHLWASWSHPPEAVRDARLIFSITPLVFLKHSKGCRARKARTHHPIQFISNIPGTSNPRSVCSACSAPSEAVLFNVSPLRASLYPDSIVLVAALCPAHPPLPMGRLKRTPASSFALTDDFAWRLQKTSQRVDSRGCRGIDPERYDS